MIWQIHGQAFHGMVGQEIARTPRSNFAMITVKLGLLFIQWCTALQNFVVFTVRGVFQSLVGN